MEKKKYINVISSWSRKIKMKICEEVKIENNCYLNEIKFRKIVVACIKQNYEQLSVQNTITMILLPKV